VIVSELASRELGSVERIELQRVQGLVFDLQRYSLHDGPGLRTNVFLKGCPLRCRWCCNPESQGTEPELALFESRCFACGDCVEVCRRGALSMLQRLHWDPKVCDRCGQCVEVCASGAVRWIGNSISAGEVLAEVLRDSAFYSGGGGITLTGGEPMLQPEFAYAILRLAQADYVHTAMETCGHAPWSHFERLLPHLDLVLFDLKHMDSGCHREGTGVGNEVILENARRIAKWFEQRGTSRAWRGRSSLDTGDSPPDAPRGMIIRLPLVPGFNMTVERVQRAAEFAREMGVGEIHLLPYHRLGQPKYRALGRSYPGEEFDLPEDTGVEAMASLVRSCGLHVRVGG
jgi:pyruvate formate lyase activating enzyme